MREFHDTVYAGERERGRTPIAERRWVRKLLLFWRRPPRRASGSFFDGPEEDFALVPRRPLRPLGSGSVALELPDEPDDVDARGLRAP
jgi:hypothetical protein